MIKKTYNKQQKGFTLIELSIAIVIIGILVGGIVLGGKIVAQSKFAKLISEFQTILTATNLFKDNYLAYPGDYNGAKSKFNCHTDNSYSTSNLIVCPGNNDGKISTTTEASKNNESGYGMNHLVHDEFLSSNFSTRNYLLSTGTVNADGVIQGTFPKSYPNELHWNYSDSYKSFPTSNTSTTITNTDAGVIKITDIHDNSSLLNQELASKIDAKIDDGKGNKGIMIIDIDNCNETISATDNNANNGDFASITSANANKECGLVFLLDEM